MSPLEELQADAYTGTETAHGPVRGPVPRAAAAVRWALNLPAAVDVRKLALPAPRDLRQWQDPRVGWGLILPDNDALSPTQRADWTDAPEPIVRLLRARPGSPVFRYRDASGFRFTKLRNYKTGADVSLDGSPLGIVLTPGQPNPLPYYLLIYGTPQQIPWTLQYTLNANRAVGRLDLTGPDLDHYVTALLAGWAGAPARGNAAVVWATDHAPSDITNLMRYAVAEPVYTKIAIDKDLKDQSQLLAGADATAGRLIAELAGRTPGLVLTTSHGMTGPLNDPTRMAAQLGVPVDANHELLDPAALLGKWSPGGAVWYGHACCSAGSDSPSRFAPLFPDASSLHDVLEGVAKVGAQVAPLPRRLLGAAQPLRAFVGHVEPTFNWTLRDPDTQQFLTAELWNALYDRLFGGWPVGHAFRDWYLRLGALATQYNLAFDAFQARNGVTAGRPTERVLLTARLSEYDVRTLVVLGDPTVTLPPLVVQP